MSKRRLLFQRLLVLGLGLCCAVLGLEVLLRAVGLAQRLGKASLRPSSDACVVLCVGDSYTACPGVPRDQTYPAQLERQLNAARPSRRFQVLNLGLNGQNSTSLRDELPANLEKYSPDVVVLLTGGANAWDFTGYEAFEQGDSVSARLADCLGRIRVVKLARLVCIGFQGGNLGEQPKPASSPPPRRPQRSSPHVCDGDGQLIRMDYAAAENSYRQALVANPNDAEAWDGLSVTLAETGRIEEGIQAGLEAIRLDPNSAQYYDHLGRLYAMTDRRQEALDWYVAGLERGDDLYDRDEKVRIMEHLLGLADRQELAMMADRLREVAAPRPQLRPFIAYIQASAAGQPRVGDWIARDLEQSVEVCRSAGIPVVLMNYPRDHPVGLSPLYEKVARQLSVPFVDNMRGFDGLPEADYFLPDGHCTQKGNALVASKVARSVLEVLATADAAPGPAPVQERRPVPPGPPR